MANEGLLIKPIKEFHTSHQVAGKSLYRYALLENSEVIRLQKNTFGLVCWEIMGFRGDQITGGPQSSADGPTPPPNHLMKTSVIGIY